VLLNRINLALPGHSTFPKNRHGRLRESEVIRFVLVQVSKRCIVAVQPVLPVSDSQALRMTTHAIRPFWIAIVTPSVVVF